MSYAFGGRLDDDSYAITYIDEDQGTAVTKGEINGVPFEGGGGGGDSLITTANVKVNYTLPEGVDEVTFSNFQELTISNSNNDPMVMGIAYSDTCIPLTELGTPEMLKIPICDNGSTNIINLGFSNGDDYLYVDSWSVVSGDATASEYVLNVYGDCEVNLTLVVGE